MRKLLLVNRGLNASSGYSKTKQSTTNASRGVFLTCLLGLFCSFFFLSSTNIQAQDVDPSLYEALEYRLIGPFRGGRSAAVTGVQTYFILELPVVAYGVPKMVVALGTIFLMVISAEVLAQ